MGSTNSALFRPAAKSTLVQTATGTQCGDHVGGDRAFVERLRAVPGDRSQRLGQCRLPEIWPRALARRRRVGKRACRCCATCFPGRAGSHATLSCTGQPSAAKQMAGWSSSSRPFRPCAASSVSRRSPLPAPSRFAPRYCQAQRTVAVGPRSIVAAAGARPEAINAITLPIPPGAYRQKQSPPIPVDCGSITHSTAQAATAASCRRWPGTQHIPGR